MTNASSAVWSDDDEKVQFQLAINLAGIPEIAQQHSMIGREVPSTWAEWESLSASSRAALDEQRRGASATVVARC